MRAAIPPGCGPFAPCRTSARDRTAYDAGPWRPGRSSVSRPVSAPDVQGSTGRTETRMVMFHRHLARQLLPGLVLPGLIYLAVSGHSSTLVALAAASSVPVLDALLRMARRERPSPFGVVFLAMTGVSIGLAFWLHSPRLILVKGAVVTGAIGLAFGISALVRRPLTRWVAMRLSVPAGE